MRILRCASILLVVGVVTRALSALFTPGQLKEVKEVPPAIGRPCNILRQMKRELISHFLEGDVMLFFLQVFRGILYPRLKLEQPSRLLLRQYFYVDG